MTELRLFDAMQAPIKARQSTEFYTLGVEVSIRLFLWCELFYIVANISSHIPSLILIFVFKYI